MGILAAFSRAIEQLPDPTFRKVLLQSVGLTLLTYIVAGLGLSYALEQIPHIDFPGVDGLIQFLSSVGLALALAFFFPTIASLFLGLFLDDIAEAVERRYYAERPPGRMLPFGSAMFYSLRFAVVVLLANLIALPFYIALWWFPPFNIVVFYGLNGYILGREYFELVAMRHLAPAAARELRRTYRGRIFIAGAIISFLLTIPVVNLLMPLIATAGMVHVFQGLNTAMLTVSMRNKI
jgi:CysZ protein